jgi:hypothetical protein
MNTLRQVLKLITHENYTVVLQTGLGQLLGESHEVARENLSGYLDYRVLGISEDWTIIIQDQI